MTDARRRWLAWGLVLALCAGPTAAAADEAPDFGWERSEAREPCALVDPLRRPLFGDLHVHTRYSLDASTQGTRTTPEQAYRFARGEEIQLQPWRGGRGERRAQLRRPLDFAAVTDHAELFGETEICNTPGLAGYDSWMCRVYRGWPRIAFFVMNARVNSGSGGTRHRFCGPDGSLCLEAATGPWRTIRVAAEAAYDRSADCRFTSFVGYEWTGSDETRNLHRNVIFRNAQVPETALSFVEAPSAWALWRGLDASCTRAIPGCEWLAIPHNSNLSGGRMFTTVDAEGRPLDATSAALRGRSEPLVEVMQHKGDSECRVGAGTADELCSFEALPYDNFMSRYLPALREPAKPESYVRSALGEGLVQQERTGANPFEFGLLASTDTHLGAPGLVMEDAYPGHGGAGIAVGDYLPDGLLDPIEFNPGGLAVIWAEENSRDALFAGLRRREVYGTSGPRIEVRLFGGWDLPEDWCARGDAVAIGYERGVPMGGNLGPRGDADAASADSAPVFAVSALRDPGTVEHPGVPLERVQIIKLWLENGEVREAVHDVAGGPSDASVDPQTCTPQGAGADRLCARWRDPDFGASERALYYARVVQNPTCRWSRYACNAAGVDCRDPATVGRGYEPCCDPGYPSAIRERAWTSPIWYAP